MRVRLQQTEQRESKEPKPLVGKRAELVDDFIRNYLLKMKMTKTLDCFQTEWYEKTTAGELTPEDVSIVADVYQRNQELDNQVKALRAELDKAKEIAHKARSTWDKFRKERDFHRMNHRRVVQEKSKLVNDLRRLRAHLATYEPTLKGLEEKYQIAMKEKAMAKLQSDRLQTRVDTLESQVRQTQMTSVKGTLEQSSSLPPQEKSKSTTQVREATVINKKTTQPAFSTDTSLLAFQDRENPYLNLSFDPQRADKYELRKTYKAHIAPISAVALHPKKNIIATASDDHTWKMWSVPGGELVLTGEGHKSWVSDIDFHPKAAQLATSSGDGTVKLWDFSKSKCLSTFTEHSQAVWGCAYHDSGDFLASCSMDHTAKLWDIRKGKCRLTLRGHVDSINAIIFQPFSNNICTCSGDKTVSLWDARTGLCIQTFYGHLNSCNHVAFNLRGDTIASSDADGGVRLWDVRMVQERLQVNAGPSAANKIAIDRSGTIMAVTSDDHSIKIYSTEDGSFLSTLDGHEEAVQAVLFEPNGQMLITAGSDNTLRIWS
ncbi:hypothetical protein GUITHDRAFT_67345 [Guillardia theta CCMP2712]|uniref:Uncharacterized protein n=2 Tax=Guillardia theta TaxID=55529 RepID=L1JPK1_GUITC|nr:hypothetical protein GUITHDRAFT_67345 [Guillardia theta CCMP2712]EKX49993.1 hypothetical protein GUITHDRAFT_67345 [Guillardia theta CCMP2712]|eukprot:XP_005836973.1 hypothetical protein GUITHDRAFT_67345 [Guillardia theta CCMP2712]